MAYRICLKEVEGIWFGVALSENGRIKASNFYKERKDIIRSIVGKLPFGSCFSEEKAEGAALDILRSMSLVYEGKPVDGVFEFELKELPSFTRRALLVTLSIPHGRVATYSGIAKALGDEGAARAVGNAEASNPFAPLVPCHRVVAFDLSLGGYGGGLEMKRAILEREGIIFLGEHISRECLWKPKEFKSSC
ncbi:MAG: methylated-DNA-[protein]-cysteine S-methyltransferase [Thermoproteota archaeon]|nr:methylated-DNA-[protein]-cysteine S-methyltransferase [Thermoproteota archaeon]